jgi:hypothetical protein
VLLFEDYQLEFFLLNNKWIDIRIGVPVRLGRAVETAMAEAQFSQKTSSL